MKSFKEQIKKLDSILKKSNAPILNYFNKGLDEDEIINYFKKHDISLRDELVALFEWHNGVDLEKAKVKQPIIEIMPMGIFYSLDNMIESRNDMKNWKYLEVGDTDNFLPLFGSGEDDLHLFKIKTGEIYYISPAVQIFGELEFNSLYSMLDCLIESYEERILQIDPIEGLEVQFEKFELKKKKFR